MKNETICHHNDDDDYYYYVGYNGSKTNHENLKQKYKKLCLCKLTSVFFFLLIKIHKSKKKIQFPLISGIFILNEI